jgi:hypothetical protein
VDPVDWNASGDGVTAYEVTHGDHHVSVEECLHGARAEPGSNRVVQVNYTMPACEPGELTGKTQVPPLLGGVNEMGLEPLYDSLQAALFDAEAGHVHHLHCLPSLRAGAATEPADPERLDINAAKLRKRLRDLATVRMPAVHSLEQEDPMGVCGGRLIECAQEGVQHGRFRRDGRARLHHNRPESDGPVAPNTRLGGCFRGCVVAQEVGLLVDFNERDRRGTLIRDVNTEG